jgi:biotin carboxylase
MTEYLLLLGAD